MKILLTHRHCMIGGLEAWMVSMQCALRAAGHTCELFFFEHGPMASLIPRDCEAHFGGLDDCLRLVKAGRFDVVHAPTMDWQVGISAVRGLGAKLIVTAHGRLPHQFTSATCDALTSVSHWLAEEMQPHTDLPVQVIYNGLELARFQPDEATNVTSPPIVAWVGRGLDLIPKHIDTLAAIAPELRRSGLRLWLAEPSGPDALAEVMPETARTLRSHAAFWGIVEPHEMPGFYQQVAASGGCVLSTSSYEGFGLALAEAQACGCPVIAPNVQGLNEVVDPFAGGVLYPFEIKPTALAELIVTTLREKEQLAWRKQAVAQHAHAQFDQTRMIKSYLQVYERAPYPTWTSTTLKRPRGDARQRWQAYLAHCWSPGERQYETSRQLAAQQEWKLAAVAARTALITCPTLYVRPSRLAHLLKTQFYAETK